MQDQIKRTRTSDAWYTELFNDNVRLRSELRFYRDLNKFLIDRLQMTSFSPSELAKEMRAGGTSG